MRVNCPIDGAELRITDRQGIEIDYCPTCRGVWLDRGELDKIIERMAQPAPAAYREEPRERYDDRPYRGDDYGSKLKRRSFLEDLLDFD
jgi:Zn-finger nucleic acid-binding protein